MQLRYWDEVSNHWTPKPDTFSKVANVDGSDPRIIQEYEARLPFQNFVFKPLCEHEYSDLVVPDVGMHYMSWFEELKIEKLSETAPYAWVGGVGTFSGVDQLTLEVGRDFRIRARMGFVVPLTHLSLVVETNEDNYYGYWDFGENQFRLHRWCYPKDDAIPKGYF